MDSVLKAYMDRVKNLPMLGAEDMEKCVVAIKQHHQKLIEGNLRLVVKTAFEIHEGWKDVEIMDLIQEGNIGLINAVNNFEITKGYKFSTYALHHVRGEMLHYIRDKAGTIKSGTTKAQREIFYNIGEIKRELDKKGANIEDVAKQFGVTPFDLAEHKPNMIDIEDPDLQNELIDYDTPERVYMQTEQRLNLRRKIKEFEATLTTEEVFIWMNRILDKTMTLQECMGPTYKKHVMSVKRLEDRVILKARTYFTSLDFIDIIGEKHGYI